MNQRKTATSLCRGAMAAAIATGFTAPALHAAPGDPLGPTFAVAENSGGPYNVFPAIARDADGDGVVAWYGADGLRARLLAADGTPKGADFLVTAQAENVASVAMDADGDFVIAWNTSPLAGGGLYLRRYQADGTPRGAAAPVSAAYDGTLGQQTLLTPAVAMDADGDFVVAWAQGRFLEHGSSYACGYGAGLCAKLGAYSVRVRRYTDGGASAQDIQTVDASVSGEVTLLGLPLGIGSTPGSPISAAMAPDGRFVVTWTHNSSLLGALSGVYARRYDTAGRAELKRLVAAQSYWPDVAMNASGAYAVTYLRERRTAAGVNSGIYIRQYPAGAGLGAAEQRVDDPSAGGNLAPYPKVAMDAAGDCVVVWPAPDYSLGNNDRVRAQRYASGGGPLGINFDIAGAPPALGGYDTPDVASTANGDFAVVWSTVWVEYPIDPFHAVNHSRIDARLYDGP
ncbi:MAG: hypothetical protein ACREVL_10660 [Solimonas sp.]